MKKFLPIALLILLVASSILYLIPGFSFDRDGKRYTFLNFPSLLNPAYSDIQLNLPGQTATYVTTIESSNQIDDPNEWNKLASRDQKILEQRLESVIGNDFEVRLHKKDDKVEFQVLTTDRLITSRILTSTNSVFELYATSSASATLDGQTSAGGQKELLNLKREDFGFAEVINTATQNSTSGQPEFTVRMPLGLFLGADKIELINSNLFSPLTITMSESEYDAGFDYNQAGVPTHLLIKGIQSQTEAEYTRSFLNTTPYKLTYTKTGEIYFLQNSKEVWTIIGIIFTTLLAAIVLNRYTVKNLSLKKLLLMIGLVIIYLAALKLLAIPLTLTNLILLAVVVLFTIFNTRVEYYMALVIILLVLKLLGYMPGLDISILNLIIFAIFTLFLWSTNYVQRTEKKYL